MKITTDTLPNWRLKPGDLHLWVASLHCSADQYEWVKSILSSEELKESQKFKSTKAQDQFIIGRSILKKILSKYLQLPTEKKTLFTYGKFGKPELAEPLQPIPFLDFNLSHSNGLALYGITSGASLGVDLEYRGREHPFDEIAERFFSTAEAQIIQQAEGEYKKRCFYNIWTKKEALLKALGLGLHASLRQFTVSSADQGKIDELTYLPFDDKLQIWNIFSLDYEPNFSISIATNQKIQNVWLNHWELINQ